ncbi:MAG TPA: hypothetical protein VIF60_22425 [Burkholderiaceae bacterium]
MQKIFPTLLGSKTNYMTTIQIVSTPPGEAPLEIRQAWIGTVLPVANNSPIPIKVPVVGVLTGRRTFAQRIWRRIARVRKNEMWEGFPIFGRQAIEELEKTNAVAANWWRQNAPHVLAAGQILIFPSACCNVLQDSRLN